MAAHPYRMELTTDPLVGQPTVLTNPYDRARQAIMARELALHEAAQRAQREAQAAAKARELQEDANRPRAPEILARTLAAERARQSGPDTAIAKAMRKAKARNRK